MRNQPIDGGKLSESQRQNFYEEMVDRVVSVEVLGRDYPDFDCEGVGVIVSPDGHVVTLGHMLKDDPNAQVQVVTVKGDVYPVDVLRIDPNVGLAMLRIKSPSFGHKKKKHRSSSTVFPYAEIRTSELLIGEEIYPIGHPGFLDFSCPCGQISFPCLEYGDWQISAPIQEKMDETEEVKETRRKNNSDPTIEYITYADNLTDLKFSDSVSLVQVNNVHGDGMGGSSGTVFFGVDGLVIGMYLFCARDQVYGIHAKTLKSFVDGVLGGTS